MLQTAVSLHLASVRPAMNICTLFIIYNISTNSPVAITRSTLKFNIGSFRIFGSSSDSGEAELLACTYLPIPRRGARFPSVLLRCEANRDEVGGSLPARCALR